MLQRKEEPVRLSPKPESIDIPIKVLFAGSLVFGIIFAILGIATYHYGVFLWVNPPLKKEVA